MVQEIKDYVNKLLGKNQQFDELLAKGDISGVIEKMKSHKDEAFKALEEYNTKTHLVMARPKKIRKNKKGERTGDQEVWRLPISYQQYINEIALVFLYGQPVKWSQSSEGTDDAYQAFLKRVKDLRFNAKIREAKRFAGSETESAMLFRVFRNDEGSADCQIRVLANSKSDEIYTKFDQYENLAAFAWGYYVKEGEDTTYHFDLYTAKTNYYCTKRALGWDVVKEVNLIGKIPVIYFRQKTEWDGSAPLTNRIEAITSKSADTNDYFADPIAVLNADVIKNLPDKDDDGKLLITNSQNGVDEAARYLTWDSAPQSKKDEIELLNKYIMQMTFTPDITTESLKSVSQLSAKALKTVMMLGVIKAQKSKESHDELLDRTASLIRAIIGNVLDVSLKSQCDALVVEHEYQEPFGDDITDAIANIVKSVESGILSQETAVSLNPLVKDPVTELERIQGEKEQAVQQQMDIFRGEQNDNREDEEREEE